MLPVFAISPNVFVRVQPRLTIRCSCFDTNSFTSSSFLQPICLHHIIRLGGLIILHQPRAMETFCSHEAVVPSDRRSLGSVFLVHVRFSQPCVRAAVNTTRNLTVRCIFNVRWSTTNCVSRDSPSG